METCFYDKQFQPTDEMLSKAIGGTKSILDEIIQFIKTEYGECHSEWKFYGAKIGWSLKIFHKKRNLFFVGPDDGFFRVAFAFDEKAYQEILNSDFPEHIKNKLIEVDVYMEGRPLRLNITDKTDAEILRKLIGVKLRN